MDALDRNDVILFQDECSVRFFPTITRMWSLKGKQPKVRTHGGRKRQHLIGAVDPLSGRMHVALSDGLKTEQFQHFLEGVLARYRTAKKVVIVVDNARVHHAKALKPFLKAHHDRIELLYLPPYSPELNPIEHFWKFMRKQVTHNTFFKTFKEFVRAIVKFVLKFKFPNKMIQSICRIC
ncbi:MAG: IS630 family transposase [Promethearchaeota archaeon]